MIPIDRRILTNWQGQVSAQTLLLAEHDLRLTWALAGINTPVYLWTWTRPKEGWGRRARETALTPSLT